MPHRLPTLGLLASLAATGACTPHPPPTVVVPPLPASHLTLSPLADLVAAGGLRWVADIRPRALLADPALIEALAGALPEKELDMQARAQGGVDLRSADEFVVAEYAGSTLFLAHQVMDPARVETAFAAHVAEVRGRAIDRNADEPGDTVVRLWGSFGKQRDALVIFGREAVAFSVGDSDAALRATELFAEHKMKRARPAWQTAPLNRVSALLGEAPLRAAAPGPFRDEWAAGLGGLLVAATAAGVALRPEGDAVRVNVVLAGPWGDRAADAADRMEKTYGRLVASRLGRLLGLDQPMTPPVVTPSPDSVGLEVRLRLRALVRGLGDATATGVAEMMKQ